MANFTFTSASMVPDASAAVQTGIAGVAITAGQLVYLDTADNKIKLARSTGTATESMLAGMAVNNAAVGQPVSYVVSGGVTTQTNAFAGAGVLVCASATAGAACPYSDVSGGARLSILGWSTATNKLTVSIANTGAVTT